MFSKIRFSNDFIISILAILFLICLYFVFDLLLSERQNSNKIVDEGRQATKELNINTEIFLKEIEDIADEITNNISTGIMNRKNLANQLSQALKFEHDISSIGALFSPYSFDENLRLYSPYIIKKGNDSEEASFDSFYDYTTQSVPWYEESITLGENWTQPFYDEISSKEFIYFTKTFSMNSNDDKDSNGLLFIGISIEDIKEKLSSLNLDYSGQPYLITTDGRYVIQPSDIRIKTADSLKDIKKYESGFVKIKDQKTNETLYQFFAPLKSSDWIVVFEIVENEILEDFSSYRKKIINIIIAFTLFLTALAFYFMKKITKNYQPKYLFWGVSIPLFVLYILGSIYICYIGLDYEDKSEKEQNAILNDTLLEDFKLDYIKESLNKKEEPPIFIPTGIFIESIDFSTTGTVNIKGIIWQKYYKIIHDDVSRTISISNANDQTLTKFFEKSFGNYTLIEWVFNINISSNFDYTKYPFANENMWLLLKHQEFDKNIVLVPDLDSYKLNSSRYLPGLDKNITIRNWEIKNSFFSYTFDSYNTNFGIDNFIGQSRFPEIYFNIIMGPNILNVFISNFLPIAIALFLMFAIFKTATGHYVVRPYATLFLALIFLQISLRRNLGANEIVYIEYYYFLTYFIMAGVSLNAVLLQNSKLGIVQYKNNLIPKLFFWPFTGLAILILNIIVFYN
ncbi:MAG: hypothetical protein DHS20C13_15320 [Thermodesulfobacteriota bacterium]|nr:MAG: hypothetical protein DHS20C13_15320 [Thermodesulfobacteriota bacterium]